MDNSNRASGKREFSELGSAHGVVDVEAIGTDTVYVLVRSGLSPAQTKLVREMALEWWSVPRVFVIVRSTMTMKAVTAPGAVEIRFRALK